MLPQNAPSHIQRRKPGKRGAVEPSGSLIGPPVACGSSNAATNAAGSVAIFSNSSRAAATPRTLSGDQSRLSAASYSGNNSSAGLTNRIDILPGAKCVPAKSSLHLEAELSVELDRRLVIDIHSQFEPREIEPIIGKVDEGRRQRRADAAAVKIVMNGHAELADMAAATFVLEDLGHTNDAPFKHRDDSSPFLGRVFHPFPPLILPDIGQAQRPPSHLWKLGESSNFLPVAGLLGADEQPCGGQRCVARRGLGIGETVWHVVLRCWADLPPGQIKSPVLRSAGPDREHGHVC